MSDLAHQIAEEVRSACERRHAARMLSSIGLAELEIAQRPRPGGPVLVNRDPCPRCGTRGDIGCKHRQGERPVPVSLATKVQPNHAHLLGARVR